MGTRTCAKSTGKPETQTIIHNKWGRYAMGSACCRALPTFPKTTRCGLCSDSSVEVSPRLCSRHRCCHSEDDGERCTGTSIDERHCIVHMSSRVILATSSSVTSEDE